MTAKAKAAETEIVFKDLRAAVVALNESGLLTNKIKLIGADKDTIVKDFMAGMDSIEDVDGKFPGPKVASDLYNKIVDMQEKAAGEKDKATEKKDKADAKAKGEGEDGKGKGKGKAKAKAAPAKASATGPGVIGSILEFIKNGPVTTEQILNKLVERFPDRTKESMTSTIRAQLGGKLGNKRMEKEKKVAFAMDENGAYTIKTEA